MTYIYIDVVYTGGPTLAVSESVDYELAELMISSNTYSFSTRPTQMLHYPESANINYILNYLSAIYYTCIVV